MKIAWFDDLTDTLCTPENPGAFVLREESFPFDGAVRRRVTLTLKPGEAPRSLRIYHGIEHIQGPGVRCWNTSFKLVEHTLEKMLSPEFRRPPPGRSAALSPKARLVSAHLAKRGFSGYINRCGTVSFDIRQTI